MSFAAWLQRLQSAEKTSIISQNCRKIHYKFAADGREMAEEYNLATGVCQRRAWRDGANITRGPAAEWRLELGDEMRPLNPAADTFVLKESLSEPQLSKRVTRIAIEWRIRNLPYPLAVYSVRPAEAAASGAGGDGSATAAAAAAAERPRRYELVVRTSNKKYYKVIPVVELERCETLPQAEAISLQHQHNTLIITYKKPPIMVDMERAVLLMLRDIETERDLDADCNQLMQQLMGAAARGADAGADEA